MKTIFLALYLHIIAQSGGFSYSLPVIMHLSYNLNLPLIDLHMQQSTITAINNAIASGNASELGRYFYSSVELTIPKAQGTYSKSQAEMLMKNFFETNPPVSFTIINQGSSTNDKSHFVLANYKTQTKTFRAYYLLREFENKLYITTLKFE